MQHTLLRSISVSDSIISIQSYTHFFWKVRESIMTEIQSFQLWQIPSFRQLMQFALGQVQVFQYWQTGHQPWGYRTQSIAGQTELVQGIPQARGIQIFDGHVGGRQVQGIQHEFLFKGKSYRLALIQQQIDFLALDIGRIALGIRGWWFDARGENQTARFSKQDARRTIRCLCRLATATTTNIQQRARTFAIALITMCRRKTFQTILAGSVRKATGCICIRTSRIVGTSHSFSSSFSRTTIICCSRSCSSSSTTTTTISIDTSSPTSLYVVVFRYFDMTNVHFLQLGFHFQTPRFGSVLLGILFLVSTRSSSSSSSSCCSSSSRRRIHTATGTSSTPSLTNMRMIAHATTARSSQ
jgi:hypothetical protein